MGYNSSMDNDLQISLFETAWGTCGILARGDRIVRFSLPGPMRTVERILTERTQGKIVRNPYFHKQLQEKVIDYFLGRPVDFSGVEVDMSGMTEFQKSVLSACRKIGYGMTASYSDLAEWVGRPVAVRAAASAIATNPIPLIIPCHRILCKNGKLGGFSAIGGIATKSRLLRLEQSAFESPEGSRCTHSGSLG
jgi:methylated-DNA-[protein]-cysteine S-methyltransferase